jgi:hypothetical protein
LVHLEIEDFKINHRNGGEQKQNARDDGTADQAHLAPFP